MVNSSDPVAYIALVAQLAAGYTSICYEWTGHVMSSQFLYLLFISFIIKRI
jgi:hypothetical protein